ncbi:MAG: methyltransferase domain-containing protein [Parvularculaceae bacterium]
MADVVDRLESVTRDFPLALFYGSGATLSMLTPACGVGAVVAADLAEERLPPETMRVAFDEEAQPFATGRFDLIVSVLTLHAANDPVGALAQMRQMLKPDGLLIAVALGEGTLGSLRRAFFQAETAIAGGVSPRVAPFGGVRDYGAALQRAGFALPVADLDRVRVTYGEPARLFSDLRGMGETSYLASRGRGLRRASFFAVLTHLASEAAMEFDLVTLTGWAPHESQQIPLRPGSARQSLAAAVRRNDGAD